MTGWLRLDGSPSNGRHNNCSTMLLELIGKMAGTVENALYARYWQTVDGLCCLKSEAFV